MRSRSPDQIALRLIGLGKEYGSRTAVRAIDLEVGAGECFGLLGPNGAGKTTTISMACGLVTPSRGRVTIGGVDLARAPLVAKAKLGYVPQELALYDELPAVDNLRYFGALYRLSGAQLARRIAWALDAAGLSDRAREPVERYSAGMKRRLNLAAALLHRPELLVLDEPTAGVDPHSRNHMFETLRALRADGVTIVYTSHYLEEVEAMCDRVAIMDHGAIVALGTIPDLIARHAGEPSVIATLAGAPESIAAAIAATLRMCDAARHGNTVRFSRPDRLTPIVSAIEAAGATIARFEAGASTLATVFLALTGRALRDEA